MDRAAVPRIAHGGLAFFNPLSERDMDEAIEQARAWAPELRLAVSDEPPPGRFDLVVCIASSHALGGFPAALARLRELAGYSGLFEAAADSGLVPLWACVAGERDWDRYEWAQVLNAERHGGEALLERAAAARRRLTMPRRRETLGFALVLFRSG